MPKNEPERSVAAAVIFVVLMVGFAVLSITGVVLGNVLALLSFWGLVIYVIFRLATKYALRHGPKGKTFLAALSALLVLSFVIVAPTHATIPGTQDYRNECLLSRTYSNEASPASGGDSYADGAFGNDVSPPPCGSYSTDYNGVGGVVAFAGANGANCGACNVAMWGGLTLYDDSFTIPSTQTVTFSGDYYLYGFLDIQGSGAVGADFYPDAYLTVSLAVSGPSSFNWTLSNPALQDTKDGCGGEIVLSGYTCNQSKTFSSDTSFSESGQLVAGTYTLKMGFIASVAITVGGIAGTSAYSCLAPVDGCYSCPMGNGCQTPFPPQGPSTCPSGLVTVISGKNNCDWVQWKYATYNCTGCADVGNGGSVGGTVIPVNKLNLILLYFFPAFGIIGGTSIFFLFIRGVRNKSRDTKIHASIDQFVRQNDR